MNKRIKLLAEQANLLGDWGEDITEGRYFVYDNLKNLEKFAELIVKECIELNNQELSFNAFERLLNKYQNHFGVEL